MLIDVITFGEAMVVFIASKEGEFKDVSRYSRGLAGAELNVAVGLTRLGHKVKYVTRLGKDPYGEYILDFIHKEKIDDSGVYMDSNYLTGSYIKSKVKTGDPKVFYFRQNSAASHIDICDMKKTYFENAKILHVSGITAALSKSSQEACFWAIEKAQQCKMKVTFDPNIRRNLWKSEEEMRSVLNRIAFRSEIILPGIAEGKILTKKERVEDIADFYLEKGVQVVVIKLGALGAYYKTSDGVGAYVKGFSVSRVIDTIGAGDAFASGFLSGILENLSIHDSVVRGNAMGAIIVTSKTDNHDLPTKLELEEYLEHVRLLA